MAVMRRLFATLLLLTAGAVQAAVGILAQPVPGTVVTDVAVPKTGGGYWPQLVNILVPSGTLGTGVIALHGGGGDNINNCIQYSMCRNIMTSFVITGATFSVGAGPQAVLTVSSDPTPLVIPGRALTVSGVTPTGYNGSWVAIAATSTTITVAMQGASDPGAYVSGGAVTSRTINVSSVYWPTMDAFNALVAFPQGQAALGGTDNANTPSFSGYIAGNVMTVTSVSGALSVGQTISGAAAGTKVIGYGTGNGYNTGTYLVSPSQTLGSVGSPVAMTANGCPYAPKSTTWSNWVMTSCQDDLSFLSDLKNYLHLTYNIPSGRFGILGHSNGGMMVERIMMESPTLFNWYGMLAGPRSIYYDYNHQYDLVSSQHSVNAMWMFGDLDSVLCEAGYTSGCTNTPIAFTASINADALDVTAISSGSLLYGQNIVSASGAPLSKGTYIDASKPTNPGDLITYAISPSQTAASQTMYASNTYDATTSQNTANASASDLVYPLPMTWDGITSTAAYWAKGMCAPVGMTNKILNYDAVKTNVTVGTLNTWSYCGGKIVVYELSDSPHDLRHMHKALGTNPLVQFLLFIKAN